MRTRASAHLDLNALQHNFHQVKKFAPRSRIMAMVKANAYGHGLVRVANALTDADAFGVATIDEATQLRQAGITKPIVVMSGFFNAEDLRYMTQQNLTAVIHQMEQLSILQQTQLTQPLTVWLKIDTGMHRLGFLPQQVAAAYKQLAENPNVEQPVRFFSHLACSDEPDSVFTQQQIQLFEKTVQWKGEKSLACSASIIAYQQTHLDWVRPGIMLYGVSPFAQRNAAEFNLKPVMTLASRLIAVKQLSKGDTVGYGATWVCPADMKVGVVSIGYGDGYPRQAQQGTPVLVNGKRCMLIGRVSMDLMTVDLTSQAEAKIGDPVVLWGPGLPVEEIARNVGTIAYELLCKVTDRVEKIWEKY